MLKLKRLFFLLLFYASFNSVAGHTQANNALFKDYEALFTTPKSYVAKHTTAEPLIDGNINERAWQAAPWTELFVDIEGAKKPAPTYATRVKMLWSDTALFIAAHLEEPHVWGTLTKRDAIVYYDNDFEVFIDPDNNTHHYYEIEVNALNTIFDLFMPKPYRNGSAAMLGYDVAGLKTALQVQGTLNNAADKDSSWAIEMAIPFRSLYMGNYWRPPAEGALWRINFSRVQWQADVVDGKYVKKKNDKGVALPEDNWVWSPQGVVNMHYPERWGYLLFTKKEDIKFSLPYDESRRPYLWLVYYKQKAYRGKHGKYAATLDELGIKTTTYSINNTSNKMKMEATSRQFMVYLSDDANTITINDEGLVQKINAPL